MGTATLRCMLAGIPVFVAFVFSIDGPGHWGSIPVGLYCLHQRVPAQCQSVLQACLSGAAHRKTLVSGFCFSFRWLGVVAELAAPQLCGVVLGFTVYAAGSFIGKAAPVQHCKTTDSKPANPASPVAKCKTQCAQRMERQVALAGWCSA